MSQYATYVQPNAAICMKHKGDHFQGSKLLRLESNQTGYIKQNWLGSSNVPGTRIESVPP